MTPNLLFLPGAAGNPDFCRPLCSLLPNRLTKTYLGWPGLGDQPPSPAVTGFADLVAWAEAAMEDQPVDLLAQSMGGAVALKIALNHPDRVRRIVLAATSGGLDVTALGGADWRGDYRRDYPDVQLSILDGWPDLTAALPSLRQPLLLLWGAADPISPVAVGRRLAEILPNARLEIVAGAGHGFIAEEPYVVVDAIRNHLT